MSYNKKSSVVLVLKVLQEYSDEEHYLTHKQIIDKIKLLYDIEIERKSIASSIAILQDLDFDIAKGNIISQDPNEGKVTKKAKIKSK